MNYSSFARGNLPNMNRKDRPMFLVKIILYITKAFFIAFVIRIERFLVEGVILVDKTDRKGRPNGAT